MTTRALFGWPESPTIDASIAVVSCTGIEVVSNPNLRATLSNKGCKKNDPPPGAVFGLNNNPTRLAVGAISLSSSSHLPPISGSKVLKPVMFPPAAQGC